VKKVTGGSFGFPSGCGFLKEIIQFQASKQAGSNLCGETRWLDRLMIEVDCLFEGVHHNAAVLTLGDVAFDLSAQFFIQRVIHEFR
jgi:hypothetical protein